MFAKSAVFHSTIQPKIINFETMQSMILDKSVPLQGFPDQLKTVYTVNKKKISRNKYATQIFNRPEIKAFRPIYTKRVVQDDLTTLPYGY